MMVNQGRRETLKSLGGLVAGVAATTTLGLSSAHARIERSGPSLDSGKDSFEHSFPPSIPRQGELRVTLVDSLDFRESTLMMSNTSDSTVTVSRLLPGNIIVVGNHIDCRQALAGGPVTLAPGKTFTTTVTASVLDESNLEITEYIDANDSLTTLALGSKVISLGGFMVDDAVVLYSDKAPPMT